MMLPSRRSLILGAGAAIITRRALALPLTSPLFRNPLAFPGGNPGFNPAHFAAGPGIRYSGVASGKTMINLLTGKGATVHGTVTAALDGHIGNVVVNNTATAYLSDVGINETPSAVTFGAIWISTTTGGFVFLNNGNLIGGSPCAALGIASGYPSLYTSGGFHRSLSLAMTLGVPYFSALSWNGSVLNQVISSILNPVNMQSATGSFVDPLPTTSQSQYDITGLSSGSNQLNGSLAAVMYSVNNFLSPQQLVEWAAAPWDFWYPPTQRSLMASELGNPASIPASVYHSLPMQGIGR